MMNCHLHLLPLQMFDGDLSESFEGESIRKDTLHSFVSECFMPRFQGPRRVSLILTPNVKEQELASEVS